jgi:hypothetical protein
VASRGSTDYGKAECVELGDAVADGCGVAEGVGLGAAVAAGARVGVAVAVGLGVAVRVGNAVPVDGAVGGFFCGALEEAVVMVKTMKLMRPLRVNPTRGIKSWAVSLCPRRIDQPKDGPHDAT